MTEPTPPSSGFGPLDPDRTAASPPAPPPSPPAPPTLGPPTPRPAAPLTPDGATPPAEATPYRATPYGATPYGATPYGASPYGASPYGATPSPYPTAPTSGGGPNYAYGPTTTYGGYGVPMAGGPVMVAPARTNGLAIASMVTSLVGVLLLICYGVGGLPGLIGAILGHVSRRQIREREEAGDGMALAGVIVGWITVALSVVIIGLVISFFVWAVNTTPPDSTFDDGVNDGFDGGFDALRLVRAAVTRAG